jgi:hypothetical protein
MIHTQQVLPANGKIQSILINMATKPLGQHQTIQRLPLVAVVHVALVATLALKINSAST